MIFFRSSLLRLAAAGILAVLALASPARADFDAGWQAFQRGDFKTALAEWRPLADAGDARAQFNLGVMYDEGRGVEQDRTMARAWWEKAAAKNHAPAEHNLANLLIAGDGGAQDYAAARAWLEKSAAQGLPRSLYTLGKLYEYGLGVARDRGEALAYYTRAAEKGYVRAQYNLGKLYRDGIDGSPPDLTRSVVWFETAALQGHANAMARLATRYVRGEGTARDSKRALAWLTLAEEFGAASAARERAAVQASMTAADVDAAQRLRAELRQRIKAGGR